MRITSQLWVQAFIRRYQQLGAFLYVVKKGNPEAGAIYIIDCRNSDKLDLYGPAPQTMIEQADDERKFELLHAQISRPEADAYLDRQADFDPDLWVVEIEGLAKQFDLEL